ncbi:sif2, partial [Symbiodinium sp. CCMP2456]
YAFAQSVKLAVFEKIVDSAIDKAKPIPEALAQYGTFDLDEKLVKMQMGAIFVTKCSMTLQSDMLGTPEILWEHDRFDAQYDSCRKYLEVGKRVDILDQRLAVLNDLYSFLQTQLEVEHSNKLEWIVIVLIVIEILLDLFHMSPFYSRRNFVICCAFLVSTGSAAFAR